MLVEQRAAQVASYLESVWLALRAGQPAPVVSLPTFAASGKLTSNRQISNG